jgi:thiamine biosynthesis lipoprotein
MKKKSWIIYVIVGIGLIAGAYCFLSKPKPVIEYIHNEGKTQGTYYSIVYQQPEGKDLQDKIENALHSFDLSLSTYNPNSIISKINQNNDSVRTDSLFEAMYKMARSVSEHTNGAFDITVGPLVNAWGFGPGFHDRKKIPDISKILPLVGYKKIRLENHKIIKENPNIFIDDNALSQGQSCDYIAKLLEDNGCINYMVEIGGEVMCKGRNSAGEKWKIGIDKPIDDPTGENQIQTIAHITNIAINTSGNYRDFYYLNGKKYAHEIDPRYGMPIVHNLLSATVVASTCMKADAYATAFMVLGVDSSMLICKSMPDMDCYLIYVDKDGKNQVVYTDGFKKYLAEK